MLLGPELVGHQEHGKVVAAGLAGGIVDRRVVAGKDLVGQVHADGDHAQGMAHETVEAVAWALAGRREVHLLAFVEILDGHVLEALHLVAQGSAKSARRTGELGKLRIAAADEGQPFGGHLGRAQLRRGVVIHVPGHEDGRGKGRHAAQLTGTQGLKTVQHVEGRLAPRPQLALPAEDGLEMIGQGLTGPDVVLDALPDIAVRFLTFDAPTGQVLRLVDLQAQQTAAPVPRAGKAQQVLAALALLPLAELLDLVEVQAASHIGMLHPGPEAILDALAGRYVRTPVGQGGQRLEAGAAPHGEGHHGIDGAGEGREVAHEVTHAGTHASTVHAQQLVEIRVGGHPVADAPRTGRSAVAGASLPGLPADAAEGWPPGGPADRTHHPRPPFRATRRAR